MKKIALAAACMLAAPLALAGPFDAFKGKIKPGMYENKMEMDMGNVPGLPPGMGKQSMTNQHCITEKDIEEGGFGKNGKVKNRDGECEIKDVKASGNSATYKMVCPKGTTGETKITFTGSGYISDTVMDIDQGGHKMTMKQRTEGKYLGPCK
jgi:hypothetical protein